MESENTFRLPQNSCVSRVLFQSLRKDDKKTSIIDSREERQITRRQLLECSLSFARFLSEECRLAEGEVVLFVADNSWLHAVGAIGTIFSAAVYASAPSHSSCDEIRILIETIGRIGLLVNFSDLNFEEFTETRKIGKKFFNQLLERKEFKEFSIKETDFDSTVSLVLSSGSTGCPKAIRRTNRNHLATLEMFSNPEIQPLSERDVFIGSSFSHICGQRSLFSCIESGSQLVVVRNDINQEEYFAAISKYSVSSAVLIPPQLNWLLRSGLKKEDLKSLEDVVTGATPLSHETHERIEREFAFRNFRNSYGMSESGFALFVPNSESKRISRETVGKVSPGFRVKVVDENGNSLGAHSVGEICIFGDQVTTGYLDERQNRNLFTEDRFLRSGDLGFYDDNGFFFIVGRIKDMIEVDGVSVAPKELENILLRHKHVTNACVVGKEDETRGHVPMAFVTVSEESHVSAEQLMEFVNSKVNDFKKLNGIQFVREMPKTSSGKVKKTLLKNSLIENK